MLLVDDEREFCLEPLSLAFAAWGVDVCCEPSGLTALERLQAGEVFDIVVTDLAMPGMSGLELLRSAGLGGRIWVLLTGRADRIATEEASRLGFLEVVHKPISVADCGALLKRCGSTPAC